MPIKVTTAKNYLGKGPNPYFAKSESSGCVEFDELVDIMANGRTTLTAPDIAGTLILLKEELIKLMADGKYVKTPIGAFHATACGSFQDPDQAFTPGEGSCKHGLRLHYRAPKEFQEDVELHAQFIRTERYAKNLPLINSVQGVAEGLDPSPGTYIRLQGLGGAMCGAAFSILPVAFTQYEIKSRYTDSFFAQYKKSVREYGKPLPPISGYERGALFPAGKACRLEAQGAAETRCLLLSSHCSIYEHHITATYRFQDYR